MQFIQGGMPPSTPYEFLFHKCKAKLSAVLELLYDKCDNQYFRRNAESPVKVSGIKTLIKLFTNFQVIAYGVVTLCSDVVGYQSFRELCCLHLHPVELNSMVLQNSSIPSHHYMASKT
jgi:hypothetical protein